MPPPPPMNQPYVQYQLPQHPHQQNLVTHPNYYQPYPALSQLQVPLPVQQPPVPPTSQPQPQSTPTAPKEDEKVVIGVPEEVHMSNTQDTNMPATSMISTSVSSARR